MPLGVWIELVCAACCSETTAGQWSYRGVPRTSMRKEAANKGWVLTKDGQGMLCAKCAREEDTTKG